MDDFTYLNTIDQIFNPQWSARKLARLEQLKKIIHHLWPHNHPSRFIQVAGTSGKGATCRFLEAGLNLFHHAGSFTSPHVFNYQERFSLNNKPATPEQISWAWEQYVRPLAITLARKHPNLTLEFHEINLLMALTLLAELPAAWGILETGIGGRYDPVTILPAQAVVITNIGHDHKELLGDEPWQRTMDKAGTTRPKYPLFTSEQNTELVSIMANLAQRTESPLIQVGNKAVSALTELLTQLPPPPDGALLTNPGQYINAALALEVILHLMPTMDPLAVARCFLPVTMPGRLQQLEDNVYADIAHNPDKITFLLTALEHAHPGASWVVVAGVSGARSALDVLSPLAQRAATLIVVDGFRQARDPGLLVTELAKLHPKATLHQAATPATGLTLARTLRQPGQNILVTGSTHVVEQALNANPRLRLLNDRFGWR